MKPKDRIAQLERELAEVREELEQYERAEELERELRELQNKLARKRPVVVPSPVSPAGHWCSCGTWVPAGGYHACIYRWPQLRPYWQTPPIYSTSGNLQQSSVQVQGHPYVQAYNANTSGHLALVRKDDPPDTGLLARVS